KIMKRILAMLIFCFGIVHYPATADTGAQPKVTAAELERKIHQQVNRVRKNYGLPQLDRDDLPVNIARKHSGDMAHYHFFSHINLQGEGPAERAERLGWNKKKQRDASTWAVGPGENIFMNNLYDKVVTIKENGLAVKKQYLWNTQEEIVQSTVQGWMDSPPHRKNILSSNYDQQGIGVVISGHEIYVTQDLF
ncbi:MAG: CAP domain-containing protein, partial [Methylobacter sp.]